jgi:hypothetical protein
MDNTAIAPVAPRTVTDIDPFDFFPNRRSALGGLGGDDDRSDPTYAFHTRYQPGAPGRLTFSVRLEGLAATTGTLVLRVLAMPADEHAIDPVVANTAQIPLATIAERGGEVSIGVEALGDASYALAGLVVEETDATLTEIAITLDHLDHGETDVAGMTEDEQTRFRAGTVAPISMLLTLDAPTLGLPISQVRTEAQLRDPHYARWARALGIGADEDGWSRVYVMRVLESYGVLARGARGLLLGEPDEAMARAVRAGGCSLDVHGVQPANGPPPAIPEALRGYDFLWSRGLCDRQSSIADGLHIIEQSLACLNVGGIAIHVFRFVASAGHDGEDMPGALVYTRAQIERLAFHLITGNHEIAQFSYDIETGRTPRPTSFGLAMRKGSF